MNNIGFKLYIIFIISWFLNLPNRIVILGDIRFDMLLFSVIVLLAIYENINRPKITSNVIHNVAIILILYVILTIPFTEWPGSVLKYGLVSFSKAVCFYYFTVIFINTEYKLKIMIATYILCQSYRVVEPLYLHMTQGYWGSAASMLGGMEVMPRLAGSPWDVLNPNGLAAVIISIMPFIISYSKLNWKMKINILLMMPLLIYALILTASRSGMIGAVMVFMYNIYISKKKYIIIPIAALSILYIYTNLTTNLQDRYLSIISSETKHSETAHGRISGSLAAAKLVLHKPIIGHGLGTSLEANANYGTIAQIPHNLFIEVGVELGTAGLAIYLWFLYVIIKEFKNKLMINTAAQEASFLSQTCNGMIPWLIILIVFSLASYGLHTPNWYLFGGLTVVISRLSKNI
ncbi:MAG: O-antigen ligase family protein [Sedimentibacter sp.]|nr:O-antigen ligase family protein [Sedimentibacter sp.]